MKKLFFLAAFVLLGSVLASARPIPVTTSCGETIYFESKDFKNVEEMIEMILQADEIICE